MSRLAIIVPYMGNACLLENTLASVLANRPEDCEVLVVLQQPYEDPYSIQGEVRFITGDCQGGVVRAFNLGLEKTDAPIVHMLCCGAEVQEGWADAALPRFLDPRIVAVAPLVLDAEDSQRIVAGGLAYRLGGAIVSLLEGSVPSAIGPNAKRILAPHPTAAFYRKSTLEAIGRLDANVGDRLAGLDAGLALQQLGWITVLEPNCRVIAPRQGVIRASVWRQAFEAERLFWRWAPILGILRCVASHGVVVTGEGICALLNLSIVPRWSGRLLGACAALAAPSSRQRMKTLQQEARCQSPSCPAAPHYRARTSSQLRAESESRKRAG